MRIVQQLFSIRTTTLVIVLAGLSAPPLFSQSDNYPLGTRAAALSNAYVMEADLWSVHHNQAGLGFQPKMAIGFHHENRFVVKEYSLHAVGFILPVRPGTFGISYSYFGYPVYNESKVGIGFGRQFGSGFSAGVQVNYHHNYLEGEFGNRNALTVEGGMQYQPGEILKFGIHLFNPTRSTISAPDTDTIPTTFRAGMSVQPLEKLTVFTQGEVRINQPSRFMAGVEYQLIQALDLRGGLVTNPFMTSFGIGYEINRISSDIAFTRHEILGFTPHFSFQVKLN